jgi:transposase InsO family protein
VNEAVALLHYQPFVLDDDRHTGVAYSWLYSEDPTRDRYGEFLFDRQALAEEVWRKAWDANRRLAAMYDGFAGVIANTCGHGSLKYKYLIHHRDSIFTKEVDEVAKAVGIEVKKTLVRGPQANAYCERLIGTIRRERLDCLIPLRRTPSERDTRRLGSTLQSRAPTQSPSPDRPTTTLHRANSLAVYVRDRSSAHHTRWITTWVSDCQRNEEAQEGITELRAAQMSAKSMRSGKANSTPQLTPAPFAITSPNSTARPGE